MRVEPSEDRGVDAQVVLLKRVVPEDGVGAAVGRAIGRGQGQGQDQDKGEKGHRVSLARSLGGRAQHTAVGH